MIGRHSIIYPIKLGLSEFQSIWPKFQAQMGGTVSQICLKIAILGVLLRFPFTHGSSDFFTTFLMPNYQSRHAISGSRVPCAPEKIEEIK